MHARDLITPGVPPLRPDDPVGRALDWMEEFKVRHLPVVEQRRLVGMVHDNALVDRNDLKAAVSTVMDDVEVPFVRDGQHVYDVMKLMSERGLTIIPVLDMNGAYLGSVNEHEALHTLAEITNIHEPGSIVVLEMLQSDYSLEKLARIVEENDAKVLSAYGRSVPGTSLLEITLKLNKEDISSILRSFERHDIAVRNTFQGSKFHTDLRERYDELMRFINM
ncbi:MAG: CBS domain-containing protein [Flavobacteriales bacterium]|nr:CBS domain-containing protein [Flavobacteriales bacterium]